jgi:hypothetical protein
VEIKPGATSGGVSVDLSDEKMNEDTSILNLRAAWIREDITPELAVGGSFYTHQARRSGFEAVDGRLESNAVVIQSGAASIYLVQLDCFAVGTGFREAVLAGTGGLITTDQLILLASHSHCGVNLDVALPELGVPGLDYYERVVGVVARSIQRLAAAPKVEAHLQYGEGPDRGQSVNRRGRRWVWSRRPLRWRRMVLLAPDSRGPRDGMIRLLKIVENGPGQKLCGLFWEYACHPVSYPRRLEASAEFPGVVRRELRKIHGNDLGILFLPGFLGNIRPRIISRRPSIRSFLSGNFFQASFRPASLTEWQGWAGSIAEDAARILREGEFHTLRGETLAIYRRQYPVAGLCPNENHQKLLTFTLLCLGYHANLVFVSAEMMIEYQELVREKLFPSGVLICACCTDGVFGYLPTTKIIQEGGYEAGGFFGPFALAGPFVENPSEKVGEMLATLRSATQAGPPSPATRPPGSNRTQEHRGC